ncbi:MAG: hypothetical protein IH944_13085 [Armatimonadetes bacterium]|nr:hypothetical protein [Armatimonadota bacterium]
MKTFVPNRLTILIWLAAFAATLVGCSQEKAEVPGVDLETGRRDSRPSMAGAGAGGGGGGGGGGGRAAFRGGPGLLVRDDVQVELSLSEEQISAIEEAMPEGGGQQDPAAAQALREETDADMQVILSAGQFQRYQEISLQREGVRALARPSIAEKLGLSDDQIKTIEDAIEAARPTGGQEGFDREAFLALLEEMNETILATLTDAQIAEWEAMLGEEFELARGQRPGMAAATED